MEVSPTDSHDHDCETDGHRFNGVEPHLTEAEGRTPTELMDVYACRECGADQYIYYGPDLTGLDAPCCDAFAADPTTHLDPTGPTLDRDWQVITRRCECTVCHTELVVDFEMFHSELQEESRVSG